MKSTLLALLALLASCGAYAQEAFQAPLVTKSLLLGIDHSDFVVAVGERGHILTSPDGVTFTQQMVPTTATLTAVTIVDDNVWAVGHDAIILHSADKGETWTVQMSAPELEKPFFDVVFVDDTHGIAIGAYGLFFRTKDGGKHWRQELHPSILSEMDQQYLAEVKQDSPEYYEEELSLILPHFNRIRLLDKTLYLVGEAGLVATSTNMGETWQRLAMEYMGSFHDVASVGDNTVMLAGLRGHVFTRKGEGDWEQIITCLSGTLNSILPGKDEIRLFGNNGIMVKLPTPLAPEPYDPWAAPRRCEAAAGLSTTQLKDKASIVNVASFKDQLIAVTANGIQHIATE